MRKIRIGNDFVVRWRIFVNQGDVALEELDKEKMTLVLIDNVGQRRVIKKFSVDGNLITFRIYGYEMMGGCAKWKLGNYSLELIVNANDVGQAIVDSCEAFALVAKSCETGGDSQDLDISVVIDMESSNLMLPYIASPFVIENGILIDRKSGKKYALTPYTEEPSGGGDNEGGDDEGGGDEPTPPPTPKPIKAYVGQVDATKSAFGQMSVEYMLEHAKELSVTDTLNGHENVTKSCVFFLIPSSLNLSAMSYTSGGLTTNVKGESLWNVLHEDVTIDNIDYFVYGYRMATVSESDPQVYDYQIKKA